MPLGASLIAGAASLVSGIFGRSDAKKQAKKEEKAIKAANAKAEQMASDMNREVRARADAAALVPVQTARQGGVDMGAFLAASEAGGFNPLTFLRSGALSLFSNDFTCTTGERAMDAAIQGQHIPQLSPVISSTRVPSMGSVFGDALTSGANQYLSDLSQDRNNAFQMEMLRASLGGINRSGVGAGRSGYVPQAFLAGSTTKTLAGASAGSNLPTTMVEVLDNRPTSPTYGKKILYPNPDYSPDTSITPFINPGLFAPVELNIRPGSYADMAIKAAGKFTGSAKEWWGDTWWPEEWQ